MPTLLELAGLPARETDGESLLAVDGDRAAIIAGTDMGALTKLAIRKPPWKLILDVESGEEEAYRLDLDPRELGATHGRTARASRDRLPRARERRASRADGGGRGHRREATLGPRLPLVTTLATFYERMFFIRRFEETLLDLFSLGKLVGTTHTYIGQEANAVGLIEHLDPDVDTIFSNHRCHGHYLAFTDDAFGLLCEVMGKAPGVCGGKGGSQHLCKGNFYSNGVLGSIVPVATGIALAEKRKGTGAVSTVFLGDGTLGEGVTYESLNIASLWRLPVLFVVENNHYAQSTPVELELAGSIAARGAAFGIEVDELDTTDVELIHDAAGRAIGRIRETGAPFFLVLNTYRFSPHSKSDDQRDPAEIEERRTRDPLSLAAERLSDDERSAIEARCEERLAETVEAADAAPAAAPGVAA